MMDAPVVREMPPAEAASDALPARPAETIWCIVCRSFRPYRSVPATPPSRHFAASHDTDRLVCVGCHTILAIVRASKESD